ncbi:hypothetical protein GCM10023196_036020 [Actinoallomurus vinaceus]|uniref:Uncharacterized protein n=1 Tax=Actinoallomurus vinaceus TaxID=1080074 RepID=A0ABP8UCQ2_9ACTN
MSESTYTIPALRDQAERMRARAADIRRAAKENAETELAAVRDRVNEVLQRAEYDAEQCDLAAAELDAIAEAKLATRPQPVAGQSPTAPDPYRPGTPAQDGGDRG